MDYQTGSFTVIKAICKGGETKDSLNILKESTKDVNGNARMSNGSNAELCVIAKKEFGLEIDKIYKLVQTMRHDLRTQWTVGSPTIHVW
jgi:hypothetical protein